jgi:hypothetical protein
MPYKLKKVLNGYKVCLEDDPSVCFSKKPIPKTRAIKQIKAISISEAKRKKKK